VKESGGAGWLRGPTFGAEIKKNGRPLEPDAGNAAEGTPAVLFRSGFMNKINQELRNSGKGFLFGWDSSFPAFLIQIFV
jgi:hypothetical protein